MAGTWKVAPGELTLKQEFQMLSGTLKTPERIVPVEGIVNGESVSVTAGGKTYQGRMNGKTLELQ